MSETAPHYLDHACYSPAAPETLAAVQEGAVALTSAHGRGATQLALDWMAERARARSSVCSLLGCPADDVTLVESTTHGLGVVAGGLDVRAGENVVVGDCDFVGVPTVWRSKERSGVQLRATPSERGQLTLDGLRQTVDKRTRVISVGVVQEVSGCPIDLDGVAEIAEAVGALLVLDGIQEAGVIGRVPDDHGVAAFTAGGHKWLRNPFGLGFLWTSESLRELLTPPYQGYFALPEPTSGWENHLAEPNTYSLDSSTLRRDGAALEIGGTPNWLGAVGLASAIDVLLRDGVREVESRALRLADRLREGLLSRGVIPLTPPGTRSAIVTFSVVPSGGEDRALAHEANRRGIAVSFRGGGGLAGIRAGCHAHNCDDDVEAVLELVSNHLATRP